VAFSWQRRLAMTIQDSHKDGQDIRDRSFKFACSIVRFCEHLCQIGGVAKMMAPQLLNSGTALYSMLEEARAGESRKDFISKCSIGLKEIREAHGRLRVHETCNVGPRDEATRLRVEANELVSIMTTIVGNTRANAGLKPIRTRQRSYAKVIANS
jgi:four helix bundle protein